MEGHKSNVDRIACQVRSFYERKEGFRIYHGTTSTTRKTKLSYDNVIDTSGFDNVLEVDTNRCVAVVEPNVSMFKLAEQSLSSGMLPPVVMEFPAITVGGKWSHTMAILGSDSTLTRGIGGFAGTSGESSSFKHGFFERTVSKIEIVLADGEVVEATKDSRADLFYGASGSFGTLGVITLLEVDLIPSMPFVELRYQPVSSTEDAVSTVERLQTDKKTEYLEGIMFGLHRGVVISGRLVDGQDSRLPVVRFLRAEDPWFYLHVEEVLGNERGTSDFCELVPIMDYLFRYDRGTFWGGKYSFEYFMVPFNWATRWALDTLLRSKTMYHALHKSHLADEYIVQDIGFPYATVPQFVDWLHQKFGFYPLWLCPLKVDKEFPLQPKQLAPFAPNARSPGMMINVGIWGPGPRRYEAFVDANRAIEEKTAELGGVKCFYAQAFYSEAEFWDIYDKSWYDRLREKYKATSLPSVQQKVNVDLSKWTPTQELPWKAYFYEKFKEQWPVKGLYGALHVLLSREYLLG